MLQEGASRHQVLFAASQAIAASLELAQVYRAIHQAAAQLMAVEIFLITLLDEANAEFEIVYQIGPAGPDPNLPRRFPLQRGLTGHVLTTGQPLRIGNLAAVDGLDTVLVSGASLPTSVLAAPLRRGDHTLGMLSAQSHALDAYTLEDEETLVLLANQAASAIANAQLFATLQAQADQLRLLNDITHLALETNDPLLMLRAVAEQIRRLMGADDCFITQWDEERQLSIPTAGYDQYPHYQGARVGESTMTQAVIQAGRALVAEDVRQSPYAAARLTAQFPKMQSALGLPLIADAQKLGAIILAYHTPQRFTPALIARGEQVAARISLALAKARLYQRAVAERSRLSALLEASRDGVALIGLDRKIWVLNTTMMQLLRLPGQPADWLQCSVQVIWRHLHNQAPAVARQGMAETRRIKRGPEPPNEGQYELFGRHIQWFNWPVLAGAEVIGRLVLLRDVTATHVAQQLQDNLAHMLVHDLRSPLSGMQLALEMLAEDPGLTTNSQELLTLTERNVTKMMRLVNSILEVNQLENGELPLTPMPVPLHQLVHRVLQAQQVTAQVKGLQLETTVAPTLPPAQADVELLDRLLQNLINNAIKFTPTGVVRVAAQWLPGPPAQLQVQVSDSGPGLSPELQGRLFQKFARGNLPGRGSGLGLAFCRMVIEAHGGRIWAENLPEQGAVFKFTLPVAESV